MEGLLGAISITSQVLGLLIGDNFIIPTSQVIAQYPYIQLDI